MAMALCWNCGAPVAGPTCQKCGAPQQAGGPPATPAYVPGGQPAVSQASMSVRPPQPAGNSYAPGGQYPPPPAGQPPGWQGQPPPGQGTWPSYQQPGYQQGYQQPMQGPAYQGMQPVGAAAAGSAGIIAAALLLPLVTGGIAAILGAAGWAFLLHTTRTNYFYYFAILLGFIVGGGVLLGAGGKRHFILAIMAAVLGLFSVVLALYFFLSLEQADGGANVFALPVWSFFGEAQRFLEVHLIMYFYFLVVPFTAAASTLRRRQR